MLFFCRSMHNTLSRRHGLFCAIEDDQSVLDHRQTVRAFVEHIAALQDFVIVDHCAVRVAEVAQVEGDALAAQAFAQLIASREQFDRAVVLWGAAEKLHQSLGFLPTPYVSDSIPSSSQRRANAWARRPSQRDGTKEEP